MSNIEINDPINPIGDIDFLTGLIDYEVNENEVDIIMPYIDCLRYMAIHYFNNCKDLKRKEKMDKINKIIKIMLNMRYECPEKKWLYYNCDVAICDILKTFWDNIDYSYKAFCIVILFQDLPFSSFDYKESVLGHLVLLWLMKDQFEFLQEMKKREMGKVIQLAGLKKYVDNDLLSAKKQLDICQTFINNDIIYWHRDFQSRLPSYKNMIHSVVKEYSQGFLELSEKFSKQAN